MRLRLITILSALSILAAHAGARPSMPLMSTFETAAAVTSLDGEWDLKLWPQGEEPVREPGAIPRTAQSIRATVPGNVEIDLERAGLLPDIMVGSNVYLTRPYEGYQWSYQRTFPSPRVGEGEKAILRFGGIDCFAEIWLNGHHIGSADNMLIEHDYDVTKYLAAKGNNTLTVIIRSAVMEAQGDILGLFSVSNMGADESVYVRKAPHMYGWDIMPRIVSAGLWRSVELHVVNRTRITDAFWHTVSVDPTHNSATVYAEFQMNVPFEMLDNMLVRVSLSKDGVDVHNVQRQVDAHSMRHIINLNGIELWWPRGYGDAALYDAVIELTDRQGNVLSRDEKKIGLRTVRLDISEINDPPAEPGRFCFIVNNERIFVRGTNWVPLDGLHSRDDSHVDSALEMVMDMNCNMIRFWGGNVYEDTRFFDICDREGIMLWQDFAMGCTFYPQTADFNRRLEEEARSVVLKLRSHPALVLWCGNNEDDASLRWSLIHYNINPNFDIVTRQTLARVLYEFDPTRPYLPSSPYYTQKVWERGSGDDLLPENHIWGPRGYYKDSFYTEAKAVFVSEIGYHGCPNRESLERMFTPGSVYPWTTGHEWNDEWTTKSVRVQPTSGKTVGRNNLMLNQVTQLFGQVPTDLDRFITASQIVQAEAMKYFVEKWRGDKWARTGIIWWNLRDGWPIISDAVVDYYNSKKLAYHYIKNVQSDVCVLINDAVDGKLQLVAVNDTRQAASGTITLRDGATGTALWSGDYTVGVNGRELVAGIDLPQGQGIIIIEYTARNESRRNHYLYGEPPFDLARYIDLINETGTYDI